MVMDEELMGSLNACGLLGGTPHIFSLVLQLGRWALRLEGGLLLPLSTSSILACPLDLMLVGRGFPLDAFHQLEQT